MIIENKGDQPIHIPISPVVAASSNLWLTATREGSGEEVTYGHRAACEPFGKGSPPLIVIQPHSEQVLLTWFVPWAAGEHEVNLTFRNYEKLRIREIWSRDEKTGLMVPRRVEEFIPNVWVGECRFRVSRIETQCDTVADSKTVEEYAKGSPPDLGYVFDLKGELDRLRATISEYPGSDLAQVTEALDTLVEMRHVFAVDVLVSLESKVRPRLGVPDGEVGMSNPVARAQHSQIVNALIRLVYNGAGYRALPTLAAIAQDRNVGETERALCIGALLAFARGTDIKRGDRILHVVTKEEQELARKAIDKIRGGMDREPPAVRWLLR